MPKRIILPERGRIELEDFDLPADSPPAGQALVRTICSLISTGTELTVLDGRYEPGTSFDRWVRYPFPMGYAVIGRIEAVGDGVEGLEQGRLVAARAPHASHHLLDAARLVPVPAGIEPANAAWFALAKIAFTGALAAECRLGDTVAVIGAGPIGQMSVRWAAVSGARRVIAIDPCGERLGLAGRGGATATIAEPVERCEAALRQANAGELADVVIEATGHPAVLSNALPLVADRGRLVLLGDTGYPSKQHLTYDVIRRGLSIRGAHDTHETPWWTGASIAAYFFELVGSGRFDLGGLNTHVFDAAGFLEAYDTARQGRCQTMGLILDWSCCDG